MASTFQRTKINPSGFHRSQLKFYIFLVPLAIFMLLPIIFIFSHAFKPIDELFAYPPRFFVQKPTLQNFMDLFAQTSKTGIPMSRYLFNSIVVTIANVILTVMVSALAGFALSKKEFKLKEIIFRLNTLALMFVPTAVIIPRFFLVKRLGLLDTFASHIFPLLAMPVGVFLIKQFMDQVPNELLEAARIDGANDYIIFYRIVLPIIKPALATIAILAFQASWNNIETSTLYINNESLKTFAFYMNTLASNVGNDVAGQGMAAAASLIMFLPNLIIFIVLQSKVMNTMAHSGIK